MFIALPVRLKDLFAETKKRLLLGGTRGQEKKAEYIDKQAAIQELEKERLLLLDRRMYGAEHILVRHAIPVIEGISPINVKPVSRGQWINDAFGYLDEDATVHPIWSCSCCGTAFDEFDEKPGWSYCPVCGSDNRGGDADG